ncbi:50S ribosomal protein L7/L12 [Candidatus Peregrinibacteria bacterium]|nr:50S ribosomal protein L7/L12 [Candidatus Peregrinibacteria bacterium]
MSDDVKNPISQDAEKILELVEKLNVLDLANLVKAMEEKFGVSAAMPVMAAAAASSGAATVSGDADEGPSEVNVELTSAGGQKIAVIKVVRELTGLGLKEAKDIVDAAPKVVKEKVDKKTADEIKAKLEAAGATVSYK